MILQNLIYFILYFILNITRNMSAGTIHVYFNLTVVISLSETIRTSCSSRVLRHSIYLLQIYLLTSDVYVPPSASVPVLPRLRREQ